MKKISFGFLSLFLLAGLGAAVGHAAGSSDHGLLDVRRSAWDAWFGGDAKTLAALLPEDALVTGAAERPFSSRADTIEASRKFHADGGKLLRLEFPSTDVRRYGDTSIVFSTYVFEIESAGKRATEKGKCVEVFVWKDGKWSHPTWALLPEKANPSPS